MAAISILGLMGAGKGHQGVKYIIAPNFAKGRRVLTNIKGFNIDELKKYCMKVLGAKEEDLGELIIISDRDIRQSCELSLKELQEIDLDDPANAEKLTSFYPFLIEKDNKEIIVDKFSFVKAGDVVVIDEAGSFYDKVSSYDLEFFRMHRHFTNDDGLSCELCFMFQTKEMVDRKFFKLMQQVYLCKKLRSLGLTNAYNLNIYDGSSMRKDTVIKNSQEFYDKKIFPIYSSYAKGKGKELNLDNRASIFKNPKFWIFIVFAVASAYASYWSLGNFFHPKPKNGAAASSTASSNPSSLPSSSQPIPQPQTPQWHIVGVVDLGSRRTLVLEDENKSMKYSQPQSCLGKGIAMTCQVDNQEIGFYIKNKFGGTNENKNNSTDSSSNNK